jgi:hypothetical protein
MDACNKPEHAALLEKALGSFGKVDVVGASLRGALPPSLREKTKKNCRNESSSPSVSII